MAKARRAVRLKDGTYYVYLRKSRKDMEREKWGDMETLARHEADINEMCARDGYPVEGKFKELVSGESISERKEFQKLMELVSRREVTGVIVHAVDRLGRGSIDEYGWVLATLQRTGTLVITPGKVYDPADPADYMALIMLMIISSGELAAQKERYKTGKNRSSKLGEFVCSKAPYGYDKVTINRQNTLKPNDKADVVRMVFERCANHEFAGAIASDLNRAGIKTMYGKNWTPTQIKRMVRCPTYKGMIQWGATRVEVLEKDGFKSSKRQVKQEQEDVIFVEGLHEAIVSEELWQAANDCVEEIAAGHRTKAKHKLNNPLAGILRCAKCGQAVVYRPKTSANRMRKNAYRHRWYNECDKWRECDADKVIAMVVDSLMELAGEIEMQVEVGEDAARLREEELSALRKEIASVERQADKLIDLYTADPPAITIEAFRKRNAALEEQMGKLTSRVVEIESAEPPDYKVLSMNVSEVAEVLKDPTQSAEYKNAMLKRVIERIDMVNLAEKSGDDKVKLDIYLKE